MLRQLCGSKSSQGIFVGAFRSMSSTTVEQATGNHATSAAVLPGSTISDVELVRGRNSLSKQATANIPRSFGNKLQVGMVFLQKFQQVQQNPLLQQLCGGKSSSERIFVGAFRSMSSTAVDQATGNHATSAAVLPGSTISDVDLVRARNSLSKQATANIPFGFGNKGGRMLAFSASYSTSRRVRKFDGEGNRPPYSQYVGWIAIVLFAIAIQVIRLWSRDDDDTISVEKLAAEVDWRREGTMSTIDNQGSCDSCWAHVATSAVEAVIKIDTGVLEKLSTQELIDCNNLCNGCEGGWPEKAFEYIQKEGISAEKDYKLLYRGQGPCRVKKNIKKTFIAGFEWIPYVEDGGAEERLKLAVSRQPVVASIVVGRKFFKYKASDGIYQREVSPLSPMHSVLIVGYGELNGKKYWIVRNSFGLSWGYKGYGLIERECGRPTGRCYIACRPLYPILNQPNSVHSPSSQQPIPHFAKDADTIGEQQLQNFPDESTIESTGNLEDELLVKKTQSGTAIFAWIK